MSAFNYTCTCGQKVSFKAANYKEVKCEVCGNILVVYYDTKTNRFEVNLKKDM